MTITKLKILTICLLWMFKPVFSQEIWRESFTLSGKGISGDSLGNMIEDMEGITSWSLDYASLKLSDENDYAKTVSTGGGRFEVRDLDGEVIWRSQWINIEGFSLVDLALYATETGSGVNSQTKYLKAFYRLDEGAEIPFHQNSDNIGNWGSASAGCEGLSGNRVQIVCYLANHYANDKVILDEVVVKAQEKPVTPALPGELLLTEVLFNPFPDGEDYVEIYNKSERTLPLSKLYLASRDKNKQLIQLNSLSGKQSIIPPGGYMAVTKDTNGVFPFYCIKAPGCFQQVSKLPSYNNDVDNVVLLNENLEIIDELYYNEKMHAPFLADEEGVALERVSLNVPTNDPGNWTSASTDSGYGTPGYENSQNSIDIIEKPVVTFTPDAFSPNYDGYNDELNIHYEMPERDFVANMKIFDAEGRFVTHLAQNVLLGSSGEFNWKGEDETGSRLPLGVYIVFVEIFNSHGDVYRYKSGVVLTDILN